MHEEFAVNGITTVSKFVATIDKKMGDEAKLPGAKEMAPAF